MTTFHKTLIREACHYARSIEITTPRRQKRHVSLLVKRRKIIAVGTNIYGKTHPLALKFDYFDATIHSEFAALVRGQKLADISQCVLYNFRVKHNFKDVGISRPCDCCQRVIRNFGPKAVYYTTNDGDFDQYVFHS